MRPSIRSRAVGEYELQFYELRVTSPLWDAYNTAFEKMFSLPNEIEEDTRSSEAERLYDPSETLDWEWYICTRLALNKHTDTHDAEETLYKNLYKLNHRLVYFHGHTGVGKSTLLRYFFGHYIPRIKKWPTDRLQKFIPVKVPIAFLDKDNLEAEWDEKIYDFLYREIEEIQTALFIMNVARFMLYPKSRNGKFIFKDGVLTPHGYDPRFVTDTERRLLTNQPMVDKRSVIEWFDENICLPEGIPTIRLFNRRAVQLLSRYYDYQFVLVVDNIDDLPEEIQMAVFRLVDERMRAYTQYDNVKFVISTRDNFVEPAMTETMQISRNFTHTIQPLLPLPFGDVLRARKKHYFDPLKEKSSAVIELADSLRVDIEDLDLFVDAVIDCFDNVEKLTDLHRIANHNVRRMLDIVEVVIKSPHIDDTMLRRVISAVVAIKTQSPTQVPRSFVARHRLVDALVRSSNTLVALKRETRLPNIYYSGSSHHYSSTLTRLFVIAIVVIEESVTFDQLDWALTHFGHRKAGIVKAVNQLLKRKVIFTNLGFTLDKDDRTRERQTLETRDLPLGEYLLYDLGASLRYMQSQAYVTPLDPKYRDKIATPKMIASGVRDFRDRVKAASALYQQVREDMIEQLDFLEQGTPESDRQTIISNFQSYGLHQTCDNIRRTLQSELEAISNTDPDLTEGLDFDALFPELKHDNWM